MNYSNWNNCTNFERNEIVFENRNKLFGAYVIRREYHRNVVVSFLTASLFIGSLFIPFLIKKEKSYNAAAEKFSQEITLETFTAQPPGIIEPLKKPNVISGPHHKDELTSRIAVSDDKIVSVKMISGIITDPVLPLSGGDPGNPTVTTAGLTIPENIPDIKPVKYAEIMPAFIGGEAELLKYLSENIRYPSKAITNNIEGTAYVYFIVDTSGMVTNVRLIRGIYSDCDNEAMRAVKSMPKWNPGSQNGKKVSVEMTLPVKFILR